MTLFLSLVLVLHILYYVVIFRRVADAPIHNEIASNQPKITLLICFKDEVDRVDKLMESILSQSADDIVLADDFSSDGTYEKLLEYKSARVQVIRATMDRPGKKQVMQDGLAAAKYDRILVTDADCIPASDDWAAHMNSVDKPLVLGYGPMTEMGTLTNQFSRFETYLTAMQYIGYALWGRPYMGVGRNLIIDRKLRYAHSDQIKGKDLAGGDDDLTINAIATAENTGICLHPDAFVYSESKQTWPSFIRQKKRHISTSTHYRMEHQILLALFSGTHIAFYTLMIIGLVTGTIGMHIAFCTFVIKQLVQYWVHRGVSQKLKLSMSFVQFVMMDILLFLYYSIMPFIILTSKNKNHWS